MGHVRGVIGPLSLLPPYLRGQMARHCSKQSFDQRDVERVYHHTYVGDGTGYTVQRKARTEETPRSIKSK